MRAAAFLAGLGLALLLLGAAPATPGAGGAPDLDAILAAARKVQESDLAAWSRFQFRRQVVREKLTANGEIKSRELLLFEITPEGDGFDEALILHDGEEPKPSEVESHREKARFTSRYRTAMEGEESDSKGGGGGLTLSFLLELATHRYAGREVIDGYPSYRLDFSPPEEDEGGGDMAERIGRSMAGSLWITEEGHHLIRARARMEKPVSFGFFLGRVSALEVALDGNPVGDGVWLPGRIEVRTEVRIIGIPTRRRNEFTYTHYVAGR